MLTGSAMLVSTKKPRVSFVIPEDLKSLLEKLAAIDQRTVSNYVLKLITDDIEQAKKDGRLEE